MTFGNDGRQMNRVEPKQEMSDQSTHSPASAPQQEQEDLFAFLARIPQEPELREPLNWMQTALEVSEFAATQGHHFHPSTLIDLFQRCNETPYARIGLMDEKLIRVHLRRQELR
jgi:hypothetical protein